MSDSIDQWPEWVENVKQWLADFFGAGVVQSESYEKASIETLFWGSRDWRNYL